MRLPAAEKVKRDSAVISDRATGFSWQSVASRNGLSARQCQNIWKRRRTSEPLPFDQHYDLLSDQLAYLDAEIEQLAVLVATTQNDSVRLGAMRTRLDARSRQVELMRAVGMLPWDLRMIQLKEEALRVARQLHDFLRDRGDLDEETVEELRKIVLSFGAKPM
jgi:hypothetical protein